MEEEFSGPVTRSKKRNMEELPLNKDIKKKKKKRKNFVLESTKLSKTDSKDNFKKIIYKALAINILDNINGRLVDEKIKDKESVKNNTKDDLLKIIKKRAKDDEYFKNLSLRQKKEVIHREDEIKNYNKSVLPIKYKILYSDIEIGSKSLILSKINQFNEMNQGDSEYFKLLRWVNGLGKIPFGEYVEFPIKLQNDNYSEITTFLSDTYTKLNEVLYGQNNVKNKFLQIVAQWISNPTSQNSVIALEGPPGVGKTSLIKNGISNVINRPFSFIPLGGASDSSMLEGSTYTYEGAQWGRISEILMESKCMNPIIFFDEVDKISTTDKGQELIGILTHLTDYTQNNSFNDNYFSGIKLDLSKALIIFSYNNKEFIPPILRDRLTILKFDEYSINDKINIAKDYLVKDIIKNIGLEPSEVEIPNETIKYIIREYGSADKGVREIKRCLEEILMRINLLKCMKTDNQEDDKNIEIKYKIKDFELPIVVTEKIASNLLENYQQKEKIPVSVTMMYS